LPPPLERDIQAAALDHWRLLGLPNTLVAAIPNQFAHGQPGLTPGLADLMVMGPEIPGDIPVGFIELKRTIKSPSSEAQDDFARLCGRLGLRYVLAVGRDEPIRILEDWRIVRKAMDPPTPTGERVLADAKRRAAA
jgi:hypothetical protein